MKIVTLFFVIATMLVANMSMVGAEDGFYVISGKKRNYAPVEKTGAGDISGYTENANEDGSMQKGEAWPKPRFTDKNDGTVLDNLTGLIWLKDANCIQNNYPGFDTDATAGDGSVTWQHALDFVAGINAGTYSRCGGSHTDWRLPNVKELESLVHYGYHEPALPNTAGNGQWTRGDPFTNVQSSYYWSATTATYGPNNAWYIFMESGVVAFRVKWAGNNVWPVRAGQ